LVHKSSPHWSDYKSSNFFVHWSVVIISNPSTDYQVKLLSGDTVDIKSASDLPDPAKIAEIAEPWIAGEIVVPKDQYGVYLLPTVDPTYPLRLGAQTVGGITACERLYNLRACLQKNKSPLISRLRTPEATAGAGLETVCGSVLNDIADIRPATTTIGCIW
jgi:hypothetical protein